MTINDILTLAKAGFTAEQISAMANVQEVPGSNSGAEAPAPDPSKGPELSNTPQPSPASTSPVQGAGGEQAPQAGATMDDVLAGITALNKNMQATMQQAMLQNSSQPNGGQPVTAESILAQIINPSHPTKEV